MACEESLDLSTFLWREEYQDDISQNEIIAINEIKLNGTISAKNVYCGREKCYTTKKFYLSLQKERLAYMEELHRKDVIRERKLSMAWAKSIEKTMNEFCNYFNVSFEKALDMLNKCIYAKIKFNDKITFIRLNYYGDRYAVKDTICGIDIRIAYYKDSTYEISFFNKRTPSISSYLQEEVVIENANKQYKVSAFFMLSPIKKKMFSS